MAQQPRDYLKPALWLMGAILAMGSGIAAHNQWEQFEAEAIALIPDTADSYELQRSNLIHERRKDLLSGVGTVATIVGGVGLFLNLRLAERRLTLDMQKIQQDAKQTETRLTSERFSRATEQLGHESIHVRLGGIYSLEQIAKDSPEDHWTVIEVLSAFIREEATEQTLVDVKATKSPILRTDIQAALTVIGRRENRREPSAIHLSQTNLRKVSLLKANLNGALLLETKLVEANLIETNLNSAYLVRVDFTEAHLERSILSRANLEEAILYKTNLKGADLKEAYLYGADLGGANLERADLRAARLFKANLVGANLVNTNLKGAYLGGANLCGVDLREADLERADFTGADLSESDLKGANLMEAQLGGANLRGTNIEGTVFPKGYVPIKSSK
jgi:uncharacterized protein YjbI with pentapeptide repeats